VSFDAPGHPATIALAGHPANARGDATYFSMLTPFAYLSATQALDKEPLSYGFKAEPDKQRPSNKPVDSETRNKRPSPGARSSLFSTGCGV
jgi:hypothetical protein